MKLKDIIISNIVWIGVFVGLMFIFNPSKIERYAFGLMGMSTVMYIVATMLLILTFALMPYTRNLLEGSDKKYGIEERKTAIYFSGMLALAMAILMSNLIPNILIAAFGANG
jgi:hypothetical protein